MNKSNLKIRDREEILILYNRFAETMQHITSSSKMLTWLIKTIYLKLEEETPTAHYLEEVYILEIKILSKIRYVDCFPSRT